MNTGFRKFDEVKDNEILDCITDVDIVYTRGGVGYYNMPNSFDIEVTSFKRGEDDKYACMYMWQFDLNGLCVYGRTWVDWIQWYRRICALLCLHDKKRLVVYVHNLSYEFQFIRKHHTWIDIFARKQRRPMKATTLEGVEFRCSYMLSHYSLSKVAEHLGLEKKVGDLDYRVKRSPDTPLTEDELGYCYWDVKIVEMYIRSEMERNDGSIIKIPMTSTGYVRRLVKESCYDYSGDRFGHKAYLQLMGELQLTMAEYELCQRAYSGGFTHANALYVGHVLEDVYSFDFASSYPAVMLCEQYPMSKGRQVEVTSVAQLEELCSRYCVIFDVRFKGLRSKVMQEQILSISKCRNVVKPMQINNGRIVYCEACSTSLTEVDWDSMKQFYEWDNIAVGTCYVYDKAYLPTKIIEAMLELYKDKTTLKGIEDKEVEYLHSKEQLNSTYGMMVTNILNEQIEYDKAHNWNVKKPNEDDLEKYNNSRTRTLFYPWGIYVTAYARRNLFSGILAVGNDYIYSDTDSIKIRHGEQHMAFIEAFNDRIRSKTQKAIETHKLPIEWAWPVDKKGRIRYIGIWEEDGVYKRFKTLGAKRYMVEYGDGKHQITIAGVAKQKGVEYIEKFASAKKRDVFDVFTNELYFPKQHSGKLILTYIDEQITVPLIDVQGNKYMVREESSIHMEESSYSLSISDEFLDYLYEIQEEMEFI